MGDVVDMDGNVLISGTSEEQVTDDDRFIVTNANDDVIGSVKQFALTGNCEDQLLQHFESPDRLNKFIAESVGRFADKDFGTVCAEDHESNLQSLKHKSMVMGVYKVSDREDLKVYLIMDAGHEIMTMLMPEDY